MVICSCIDTGFGGEGAFSGQRNLSPCGDECCASGNTACACDNGYFSRPAFGYVCPDVLTMIIVIKHDVSLCLC